MYTTKYTDVLTARLVRISMCSVLYKKSIILTIIILLVVAVNNHNTIYLYIHTRVLIYIYICVGSHVYVLGPDDHIRRQLRLRHADVVLRGGLLHC